MYRVFGDYGYESEQELEEFASLDTAIRWAERYCRRDLGGYRVVEVASFRADGEYVTHWRKMEDDICQHD